MRKGLKIAFFGSSLVSAYMNPPAYYFRGIVRALHELGHEVTFYEPNLVERLRHRDIADPPWARVVIYPARREHDLYPLYTDAHEADLIIKVSMTGVFDEILNESLLNLRTRSNLVVFWDMTPSFTLCSLQLNPTAPLKTLIPRYDLILTCGGGESVVRSYQELGAKQCEVILNALDPILHFPVPPDDRFHCDLALAENRYPDQTARLEELFFNPASSLMEYRFFLAGTGWQDQTLPQNVRYLGQLHTRDFNAFNGTPKCLLQMSGKGESRLGVLPTSKTIEAVGAGACIITDEPEKITMFLEPGQEFLIARTSEEVIDHLRSVSMDRAREIGKAALQHLLREHTYFHRAAQLERLIGASRIVREVVFY